MSEIRFEPLFHFIEANLHRKISMTEAARAALFSPVHMTRLFQFAYGMTPAEYIRRRRLTESVVALQDNSKTVLEIALDFGFEHEQSFTRAFRAEFGITPGRYRAEKPELPILLPIQDYGAACSGGRLFGPEAVYLPEIRLLGTWHNIPYRNSARLAPQAALDFWDNTRPLLPGGCRADVYYGLTQHFRDGRNYSCYLTAIRQQEDETVLPAAARHEYAIPPAAARHPDSSVPPGKASASISPSLSGIPAGHASLPGGASAGPDIGAKPPLLLPFEPGTACFGGCPCIKFHYIGNHHYREISQQTASRMYRLIGRYVFGTEALPDISRTIHLEKINLAGFDGKYCLLEWFAPLSRAASGSAKPSEKNDKKSSVRRTGATL